ncbi:CHASE2 domain-containing protein [Roseospira visakhapatnamensis]|uniref:Class 3 adenylate cyclase/CHASE2 domain-containing sensor protein n=1 Tax=Roseospira visakhapatnamensis TaxID=390880 RepID=A0A7W6RFC4_9PROT|nr:adenylate/guanylate cyclase domain-containing protein [Roseospira visakhapatnamensis]MBB4267443.1 class 3 adenylate cyclase/CHASE2 domain-containing sensor protein [Roseospira visakhapatnamensis]
MTVRPYKLATVLVGAVLSALASLAMGTHSRLDGLLLDAVVTGRAALLPDEEARARDRSPVAVVALDPRSLAAPDLASSPRAMMQPQFGALTEAVFAAGARALAFDFVFAFRGGAFLDGWDRSFQTALAANGTRVVLGRDRAVAPDVAYWGPLAARPAGRLGIQELIPDGDGIIRRVNMVYWLQPPPPGDSRPLLRLAPRDDAKPLFTLAGAALARAGETSLPRQVLLAPDRHLEALPTYALVDVLRCAKADPATLAAAFADTVVFFGSTIPSEDRKWTSARFLAPPEAPAPALQPAGTPGDPDAGCALTPRPASDAKVLSVPGVHVHAAAAHAVLTGRTPGEIPAWSRHVVAGVSGAAGVVAVLHAPLWLALGLVAAGLAILGAAALVGLVGGTWLPLGLPMGALAMAALGAYAVRYLLEERQHKRMREAFGRYVAPQLVQKIAEDESSLDRGGEVRDLSVWIADIANYSSLSEFADPKEVGRLLNRVLGAVAERVEAQGGYVAQYSGDAVVATFGTFGDQPDHADRAVRGALEARETVMALSREMTRATGAPSLDLRVGVSSDAMLVGNIGAERRLSFTVIGDGINTAARLESANKQLGSRILVSHKTREQCSETLRFRLVDKIRVKGRQQAVTLYEPLGETTGGPAADDEEAQAPHRRYERALSRYWARDFAEARALLADLAAQDPVARALLPRVEAAIRTPPGEDWDGVYDLPVK